MARVDRDTCEDRPAEGRLPIEHGVDQMCPSSRESVRGLSSLAILLTQSSQLRQTHCCIWLLNVACSPHQTVSSHVRMIINGTRPMRITAAITLERRLLETSGRGMFDIVVVLISYPERLHGAGSTISPWMAVALVSSVST